jgi:uncharacterized membrane protein YphA (DoxX/SURF4 family)
VVSFLNNLGLLLLRLVTGSLVSIFAAREMAQRSNVIQETLEFFNIGAPDIVKVFVGCAILIFGVMLVVGVWPRFMALVLLIFLAMGGYCWLPQASPINFHLEALYGIVLFYLFIVGGGQWAVSRRRTKKGQSVLDTEQSILAGDIRPSIFKGEENGQTVLKPPSKAIENDLFEDKDLLDLDSEDDEGKDSSSKSSS